MALRPAAILTQVDAGNGPQIVVTVREAHRYLSLWQVNRQRQLRQVVRRLNELNQMIAEGAMDGQDVQPLVQERRVMRARHVRVGSSYRYISETLPYLIAIMGGPPPGIPPDMGGEDDRGAD